MTDIRVTPSGPGLCGLIGEHPAMQRVFAAIQRTARRSEPVLIQGATGTGKELVAEAIYRMSQAKGAFVPVNVATLPDGLAEAELFGVRRGAYTGAVVNRAGLVATARDGVLYLDEAADLDPAVQVKLLRLLDTSQVRAVGSDLECNVPFRLVISTQQPARELLAGGRWREDFYHRVLRLPIELPTLAERQSDIELLANHFLNQQHQPPLDPSDIRQLMDYSWPGNVRELRNAVERAVALADGEPVTGEDIVAQLQRAQAKRLGADGRRPGRTLRDVERAHLEMLLLEVHGDVPAVASIIGLSRSQTYRKMDSLGIPVMRRPRQA